MFLHNFLLNSTYRLLIDEFYFFYFGDLYGRTKFVHDFSERNF